MSSASDARLTSSSFPTALSDLYITDPATAPNLYSTLKTLRKSALSIPNRLRSILSDASYVINTVHPSFPCLPILANERCGSWYIPPHLKSGSAYFKSTDGHYGQWDFSLRRLNLSVLQELGRSGGAVLIDTTRRGKRMPDALRRTVPIWVLVWNRLLFPELRSQGEEEHWAWRLQHPGLEPSEVRMIEARADGWIEGLNGLGLDLEALKKQLVRPIRCRWVVRGEEFECQDEGDDDDASKNQDPKTPSEERCNLFVLCSASKRVLGAEMSEDGYIQGAGDDAEGWSRGLTSNIFWKHKDHLLTTPEDELSELIDSFVREQKQQVSTTNTLTRTLQIAPTQNIFIATSSTAVPAVDSVTEGSDTDVVFDLLINCNQNETGDSSNTLNLGCRSGKLGSRDLREKLSSVYASVLDVVKKKKAMDARILIVCEDGRDLSIGVTTALLCLLYDDEGNLDVSKAKSVDKQLVKKRLAWITSLKPDANPSRSTLQSVNSFLIERPF